MAKNPKQQQAGGAEKTPSAPPAIPYPPPASWQGPISWKGTPLREVEDYSREIPIDSIFTRGEAVLTLSESTGPGITRQAYRALPALFRLERGKPLEVCMPGLDGRCWVLRPVREGRQTRWLLFSGETYQSATDPVVSADLPTVERMHVQSILPLAGTREVVSLAIDESGRSERLPKRDPDPRD